MYHDSSSAPNRRECLAIFGGALGASVLSIRAARAAESPLPFATLDHVSLTVSDPQKSATFYARVFGGAVYQNNQEGLRFLRLGSCYMSIRPAAAGEAYRVDHVCPGVEGYRADQAQRTLEGRGVGVQKTGQGLFITDPDGIRIQLAAANSWSSSMRVASPESGATAAVFQPTGYDHLLLDVTDPSKSAVFYEKIFGPVTQRNNNRTWFQSGKSRIGLFPADGKHHPGVDHFCVSAEKFDYDAAMKKLGEAGAHLEAPEVAGAPEFRDPDGILVQVMGPRKQS